MGLEPTRLSVPVPKTGVSTIPPQPEIVLVPPHFMELFYSVSQLEMLIFEQYVGFKPTPSDWKSEMLITNTSTALTKPKCLICQGHLGIPLSREQESNLQPADYKSAALPIELSRHR